MKFAHFSDCHIGGWKEDKLKEVNLECFKKAVNKVVERKVDFLLIAGDLFNTALPQIDYIKEVTSELKRLKDLEIRVYIVAGSHDYSPSGKTMLEVLEKAGLIENVMKFEEGKLKFTIDKSGVKITGILGKKGGLELSEYERLDKEALEKEEGFKIFMFHTAINEFKPRDFSEVEGADLASLPGNFNYYAGGHVHYIFKKDFGKGYLTFPGALFPNNFKELEDYPYGGVYFYDGEKLEFEEIKVKEIISKEIDVSNLTPEKATQKIIEEMKKVNFKDKIVTIRIIGEIEGKTSEIKFKEIFESLEEAYFVLKNTARLSSKLVEKIEMKKGNVEEIETQILKEVVEDQKIKLDEKEEEFTKELIRILGVEKEEGENVADFEKRVITDAMKVLKIEN